MKNRRAGISLIEIIIAIVLIAVVIITALQFLIYCDTFAMKADAKITAENFAKERMENLYQKEYADGEQKRDFIYIKDAVEAMYYFFSHPEKNGIYNLGTGTAHSWNELARAMFLAMGKKPDIKYIDMPETLRPKYQYFTEAETGKLGKAGCGLEFRPLEASVKDYVGYLEKQEYL